MHLEDGGVGPLREPLGDELLMQAHRVAPRRYVYRRREHFADGPAGQEPGRPEGPMPVQRDAGECVVVTRHRRIVPLDAESAVRKAESPASRSNCPPVVHSEWPAGRAVSRRGGNRGPRVAREWSSQEPSEEWDSTALRASPS